MPDRKREAAREFAIKILEILDGNQISETKLTIEQLPGNLSPLVRLQLSNISNLQNILETSGYQLKLIDVEGRDNVKIIMVKNSDGNSVSLLITIIGER